MLMLITFVVVLISLSFSQSLVCRLEVEVVTAHLVYLHPSSPHTSLVTACGSAVEGYSLGHVVEADLGVGVVSAIVGSEEGWMVMLFQRIQTQTSFAPRRWTFLDGVCLFQLLKEMGFNNSAPVLDVGDVLQLQVKSVLTNLSDERIIPQLIPHHIGAITVMFDNASLFDFTATESGENMSCVLSVSLWQRPSLSQVQSQVTFTLQACPASCVCNVSVTINSGCPLEKGLVFLYPEQSEEEYYFLPFNYRPPSSLGMGIATSPHVYNANPALPFPDCHLNISHDPIYKQCEGKASRSDCNCSPEQAMSSEISQSDCIQKVYEHLFANTLPLRFSMGLENQTEIPSSTIQIEELNNRTDFRVTTATPREIIISGAGLYHFRANLTKTLSFCSLTTQFTVFVVRPPLQTSEQQIIASLTAVGCGLTLLLAYMLHSYFSKFQSRLLHLPYTHTCSGEE